MYSQTLQQVVKTLQAELSKLEEVERKSGVIDPMDLEVADRVEYLNLIAVIDRIEDSLEILDKPIEHDPVWFE